MKFQNSGIEKELSYSILKCFWKNGSLKEIRPHSNGNNFTISLSELDIAEGVYFLKLHQIKDRRSINLRLSNRTKTF
ncbi:MAG: hypothetical protein IPN87_11355 [Saprospiraceae bacterium]|nr:hypothetical protein [Candidatus Brachybacter algidus]